MAYVFAIGLFLGLRHALDADHIAAVASLATRAKSVRGTVRLGLAWGAGHALTLFAVCAFVLATEGGLSPGFAGLLEFLVGAMLAGLGLDVVRRVVRDRIHAHIHRHPGRDVHIHVHTHARDGAHADSAHAHRHDSGLPKRAALVGLMHGLAGSAALLLLSLGTAETFVYGIAYVALFGLGSMLGMAALSVAIALPLRHGARFVTWGYNGVHALIGAVTIGLGAVLMSETGPAALRWVQTV